MNLKNLNVLELNSEELKNTDGGFFDKFVQVATVFIYLYNEGGDFIEGFEEGWNS